MVLSIAESIPNQCEYTISQQQRNGRQYGTIRPILKFRISNWVLLILEESKSARFSNESKLHHTHRLVWNASIWPMISGRLVILKRLARCDWREQATLQDAYKWLRFERSLWKARYEVVYEKWVTVTHAAHRKATPSEAFFRRKGSRLIILSVLVNFILPDA